MTTYNVEVKSYMINELSEEAQERAYQNWVGNGGEYFYDSDEITATMDAFCKYFDVSVFGWEYDSYSHNYNFSVNVDDDVDELSGARLTTYVEDNTEYGSFFIEMHDIW